MAGLPASFAACRWPTCLALHTSDQPDADIARVVVGVVGRLASLLRPTRKRFLQALQHLLCLLIQQLPRHFVPLEIEIANHRDHPQANRLAKRNHRLYPALARSLAECGPNLLDILRNWCVRHVTGGDDLWQHHACLFGNARSLGELDFEETAILAPKRQNGWSALATPAPCVQRLPTPAASVTTAISPRSIAF